MFVCLASAEFPRKTSVVRNMALVSGYQRFASSAPGSKVTLFVPVGSNITEICGTESAYRSIDNAPEGKKKKKLRISARVHSKTILLSLLE